MKVKIENKSRVQNLDLLIQLENKKEISDFKTMLNLAERECFILVRHYPKDILELIEKLKKKLE